MLSAAQARARLLVSWTIAPLLAAYAGGVARPEDRRHAADVDDLAAARLLHRRVDGLRHQEGAGQVPVHDRLPLVERHVLRRLADDDPGVVDQDVDPAEPAEDLGDGPLDLVGAG